MRRITLHKLLLVVGAALMLYGLGSGQSTPKPHDGVANPIELKEVSFEYALHNSPGQLVWHKPEAGAPDQIPATAQRLRVIAKVTNRPAGSTIGLKAFLHEVCPSPDPPKNFLNRLRHLTDSEPMGTQQIGPDGRVTIELPVHCEGCEKAVCGKSCGNDRNHLGEGPHNLTVTASDETLEAAKPTETKAAAKPSSVRFLIKSVCPKKMKAAVRTRS